MATRVSITNPAELPSVLDAIHDRWFESAAITFDPLSGELRVPFEVEVSEDARMVRNWIITRRFEVPVVLGVLRIGSVLSYRIDDDAEVGRYDFNTIEYDPRASRLRITTGVPMLLEAIVERFSVSVEVTDEVVSKKRTFSFFGWLA
jgi:hypothetical protein